MSDGLDDLQTLKDFVTAAIAPQVFEQALNRTASLEALLSAAQPPAYRSHAGSLFHYLIAVDYGDLAEVVDAQDAIARFLQQRGITVMPDEQAARDLEFMLSAQPRWLDADTKYLAGLLAEAPPLADKARKAWLKAAILERFRYIKKPPRWLQNPEWPIAATGPLVFLGQLDVDDYFHDMAAVYVFHDPANGERVTVVQVA